MTPEDVKYWMNQVPPAQVALNQRRLSNAYGLTYAYDMGLSEPIDCHFSDTADGPMLEHAFVGGVDIKSVLELIPKRIAHIEAIAYSHLERQAKQINAERRLDRLLMKPWDYA